MRLLFSLIYGIYILGINGKNRVLSDLAFGRKFLRTVVNKQVLPFSSVVFVGSYRYWSSPTGGSLPGANLRQGCREQACLFQSRTSPPVPISYVAPCSNLVRRPCSNLIPYVAPCSNPIPHTAPRPNFPRVLYQIPYVPLASIPRLVE